MADALGPNQSKGMIPATGDPISGAPLIMISSSRQLNRLFDSKTFKPRQHRTSYLSACTLLSEFPSFFPPPLSFVLYCLFLSRVDSRLSILPQLSRGLFLFFFFFPSSPLLTNRCPMQITLFDRFTRLAFPGRNISALFLSSTDTFDGFFVLDPLISLT